MIVKLGGSNSGWATGLATPDVRNLYVEDRHQAAARAAGLLVDHYWANGVHGTPDQVAARIVASGQVRAGETLWWDVEQFTNASGRQWTVDELRAYSLALEAAGIPRARQGVYLNLSTAQGRGYRAAGLDRLWLAYYTDAPTVTVGGGWGVPEFWQYTQTGRLPGYTGDLDLNRSTGVRTA